MEGGDADGLAPGFAVAPAAAGQIVGDGSKHVWLAVPDVAAAIAIEVDGVGQVRAGHELRLAHRAGPALVARPGETSPLSRMRRAFISSLRK